jgi:hypothetical protein
MVGYAMNIYYLWRDAGTIGYDESEAFVIVAHDESEASYLANNQHGDEGAVWGDPKIVTIQKIGVGAGPSRVIVRDFNAG